MAKITANISVRGVDLKEILAQAQSQVEELGGTGWKPTEVSLYGIDDIAAKEGLARLWSASITFEGQV